MWSTSAGGSTASWTSSGPAHRPPNDSDAPGSGFFQDLFSGVALSRAVDSAWGTVQAGTQAVTSAASDARRAVLEALDIEDASARRRQVAPSTAPTWTTWRSRDGAHAFSPRVPVPADPQRLLLALFELTRVMLEQARIHGEDVIQPVTGLVVLVNLSAFLAPDGLPLHQVCLCPGRVLEHGEWERLVTAPFVHHDATHLTNNLAVALPDCLYLERAHGSGALLRDLAVMTLLSNGLYVAYAVYARSVLKRGGEYYGSAIGFSAVALALRVVAGRERNTTVLFLGVLPMPSSLSWVPSLIMSTLLIPRSGFAGHVCGVAAGLLQTYIVRPALNFISQQGSADSSDSTGSTARPLRPRFYGGGTTGGRPLGSRGRSTWRVGLGRWAKELGLQVVVLAGTVALLSFARHHMNSSRKTSAWLYR